MQIAVRNWTGIDVDNNGEVFSKTELFNSFLCLLGKHFFFQIWRLLMGWGVNQKLQTFKMTRVFWKYVPHLQTKKKSCFIQNGGTDYYLFYLYIDSDHSCSWHSGAFQHSQLKTFFKKKKNKSFNLVCTCLSWDVFHFNPTFMFF